MSQGLGEFRFTFHKAIEGGAVLAGTLAQRIFAEWVAEELRAMPEGRTPDDVLGVLDLKPRLLALIKFIRHSNGPDA